MFTQSVGDAASGRNRSGSGGVHFGQVEENAANLPLFHPADLTAKIMPIDRHADEVARLERLGATQTEAAAGDIEQMRGMIFAMLVTQQAFARNRDSGSSSATVLPVSHHCKGCD